LKRAFPQKVKPVSCHPSASANDAEVGQLRQTPSGVNRRARTSAAMIGLALSMGASSLLIPRQSDGAAAAESVATESTAEVVPLAYHVAVLPAQSVVELAAAPDQSPIPAVTHVVREGETLWQIAQRHHVSVSAIATANGIAAQDVIRVGQTLNIPTSAASSRRSAPVAEQSFRPVDAQLNPLAESNIDSDDGLKAERDTALQRLRQERDKLRNSLTDLRTGSSPYSTATPPKVRATVSEGQTNRPLQHSPVSPQPVESADIPSSETVVTSEADAGTHVTHQVKPGETLGAIALSYRVSQRDLVSLNHLATPDRLSVHQTILIPASSSEQELEATTPVLAQPTAPEATVGGVPQPVVPQPEVASASGSVVYRVNPGDTLGEIAQTYSIPASSVTNANQLSNPNVILVGQVLQIPVDSAGTSSVDASPIASATIPANSVTEQFRPEGFSSSLAVTSHHQANGSVSVPTVPSAEPEYQDRSSAESLVQAEIPVVAPDPAAAPLEQQVAAAPLVDTATSGAEKSTQETASTGSNPYVAQLMTEILAMRDRYRSTGSTAAAQPQPPTIVAATPEVVPSPLASADVNPEFSPASYLATANAQSPGFQGRAENTAPVSQAAPESDAPAATRQPQLLATAPLGSENYEPLLQPIAGQLVSPDLPPLPGAEAFLPNSSPSFDGFIWPSRGVLSSGYGWRWGRMHRGIDIAAPIGTPVHAAAEGTIEFSAWNSGGYGNMIDIRHANGTVTRYAHLSRSLVRAGQRVGQGEQIGLVGSTGYSTGPHLHFEVHLPNQGTVNPIAYLPGR
jgi:murein DD-endopeptidase MepM/ murein hydrolase activator NlpD